MGSRMGVDANRLWFGRGRADNSEDNHNELVNPGEKSWKWTTVEGFMDEREGNYPFGSA